MKAFQQQDEPIRGKFIRRLLSKSRRQLADVVVEPDHPVNERTSGARQQVSTVLLEFFVQTVDLGLLRGVVRQLGFESGQNALDSLVDLPRNNNMWLIYAAARHCFGGGLVGLRRNIGLLDVVGHASPTCRGQHWGILAGTAVYVVLMSAFA